VATSPLDALADINNGLLETGNTDVLVEACASKDVERRRNELNLDLGLLGVGSLGSAQGGLDGVDTLVTEAGDLDIGTKLGGLGSETLADVKLKLVRDRSGRESDVIPDLRVSVL
jgi:hypothetical protein